MFQVAFCARKYLEMELYLKKKVWFDPLSQMEFYTEKSCVD